MIKFDPNKIIHDDTLGTGKYGFVCAYRDKEKPTDERWAVKTIVASSSNVTRAIQEIVLGFSFNHPNVLSVKGYHLHYNEKTQKWTIKMKLPRMKKTLEELLRQYNEASMFFSLKEVVELFYCLASGLGYLHGQKVIHRDIKLDNILIDSNGDPVLADIGIGIFTESETNVTVSDWAGSANFWAPEVAKQLPIKKGDMYKTDIWSLGIVMAKLCLGKTQKAIDTVSSENGEDKERLIKSKFNELKDKYDPELLELIAALVVSNPDKRTITAKQIVEALEKRYPQILRLRKKESIIEISQSEKQLAQSSAQELLNQPALSVLQEESLPVKLSDEKGKENVHVLPSQKSHNNKHEEKSAQPQDVKALKQKLNALKKDLNKTWKDIYKLSVAEGPIRLLLDPENPEVINNENFAKFMKDLFENQHAEALAHLEGFKFSFAYCNGLSIRSMKLALKQISSECHNLYFLELDLWGYNQNINGLYGYIGSTMPQLRNFGLFMQECENIEGQLVALNSILLPKLTQLERLSLNFSNCPNMDEDALKDLMAQIGEFAPNLTKLQLYFNDSLEVTDDGIIALSNKVGTNLKNLTSFELMLSGCTKISENTIYELAKNVGSNLKCLEDLKFGLIGISISPDKEKAIKDSLSHIPNCLIATR